MDAIALIPRSTPRSGATLTFGTRRRGWRMRSVRSAMRLSSNRRSWSRETGQRHHDRENDDSHGDGQRAGQLRPEHRPRFFFGQPQLGQFVSKELFHRNPQSVALVYSASFRTSHSDTQRTYGASQRPHWPTPPSARHRPSGSHPLPPPLPRRSPPAQCRPSYGTSAT